MKETPLLMIAEMVNATLRIENPKTQTRRLNGLKEINKDPDVWKFICYKYIGFDLHAVFQNKHTQEFKNIKSPYGEPGDQIWVRETCRAEELENGLDGVRYTADGEFIQIQDTPQAGIKWLKMKIYGCKSGRSLSLLEGPQVPSIHMPRWASRIQLEITSIRVERLQDCTENDAIAEGIDGKLCEKFTTTSPSRFNVKLAALHAYFGLFEAINGAGTYEANPWVWVIEFRRIKP